MRSIENIQSRTLLVNEKAVSGANTLSTITVTADADETWVVHQLQVSFSGTPTAGTNVIIQDGVTTVATFYMSSAGLNQRIKFDHGFAISKNSNLVVTASAAGSGIISSMVLQYS